MPLQQLILKPWTFRWLRPGTDEPSAHPWHQISINSCIMATHFQANADSGVTNDRQSGVPRGRTCLVKEHDSTRASAHAHKTRNLAVAEIVETKVGAGFKPAPTRHNPEALTPSRSLAPSLILLSPCGISLLRYLLILLCSSRIGLGEGSLLLGYALIGLRCALIS